MTVSSLKKIGCGNTIIRKVIIENMNSFGYEEIPLGRGFTLITGRNGTGKSTIFHAILFGLGGSDPGGRKKPWTSFIRTNEKAAAVTLEIAKDGALYVLKRVIRAGGGSRYYVKLPGDKKQKAVTRSTYISVVASLGYQTDNVFTFVAQGHVNAISEMKGDVLAEFIESGLGLTPLRVRILEEKNRISMLEKQIRSLEGERSNAEYELEKISADLDKLKEKKRIREKLDLLNKELLWLNRHKMEHEIAEKEKELERLKRKEEDIKKRIGDLTAKKNNLLDKITEIDKKISEWTEEKVRISETLKKEKEIADNWESEKKELADKKLRINSEKITVSHQLDMLIYEIGTIEGNLTHNYGILGGLEKQKNELIKKFEEYTAIRNRYGKIYDKLESLLRKKKELESELGEIDARLRADQERKIELNAYIAKLKAELDNAKWFIKDPEKWSAPSIELYIDRIKHSLERLKNEEEIYKREYHLVLKKIDRYREWIAKNEIPKPDDILRVMETIRKNPSIKAAGPLIDLIKFDPKYTKAVTTVLGDSGRFVFIAYNSESFNIIQQIILNTGAKASVFLPNKQEYKPPQRIDFAEILGSRAADVFGYLMDLIDVNDVPEVRKAVYSLCRNVLVVKNPSVARMIFKSGRYKGRIVTEEGLLFKWTKHGMLCSVNPTDELSSVRDIRLRLADAEKKRDDLRGKLDKLVERIRKLERAKTGLEKKLEKIGKLFASYNAMEKCKNEIREIDRRNAELTEKANTINIKLNELRNEIGRLRKEIPYKKENIDEFLIEYPSKINEIQMEINDITKKINDGEFDLKIKLNEQKEKERTLAELEAELTRLDEEIHKKDREFVKRINKINKLERSLNKLIKDMRKNRKEKERLVKENLPALEKEISELERNMGKIGAEISALSANINDEKRKLKEISMLVDEEHIKFEIRPVTAVENEIRLYKERLKKYLYIPDDLEDIAENLKRKIGQINEKRRQTQEEVEAALSAVGKLENEYFTEFDNMLKLIMENTDERFEKIGRAFKIIMEIEKDIENPSIRIMVSEGGNTFRNINTMSGGEVTLVVISIIFTLQQLNPSPICILDEADMHLDDVNVDSLTRLLKLITEKVPQFIMIMPSKDTPLYRYADHILGTARTGPDNLSVCIKYPKDSCKNIPAAS